MQPGCTAFRSGRRCNVQLAWLFVVATIAAATVPAYALVSPSPLSAKPEDAEIERSRVLPNRLRPVDDPPLVSGVGRFLGQREAPKTAAAKSAENGDFAAMLNALAVGPDAAGTKRLDTFLASYPQSRWAPAVRLERARQLHGRGRFDAAVADWDEVWTRTREGKDEGSRASADEALKNLLEAAMASGDADRIRELIAHHETRPQNGTLEGTIWRAQRAAWLLKRNPGQSVMCGPLSIYAVLEYQGRPVKLVTLNDVTPGHIGVGLSLSEVKAYADRIGWPAQVARRMGQAPIPLPAIMHHKAGHFSALLEKRDGSYAMEDRARFFTGWLEEQTVDETASGYFLVAAGPLPAGWMAVGEDEATRITGKDGIHGAAPTDEATNPNAPTAGGDCGVPMGSGWGGGGGGTPGMPRYAISPMLATLRIEDRPVGYRPPVGPAVWFTLAYAQGDGGRPTSDPNYANVGKDWTFYWSAYVQGASSPANGQELIVRLPGGGSETLVYSNSTLRYGPNDQSFAYVLRVSNTYTRVLRDGTREIYNAPDSPTTPTRIFLSQVIDPQGNVLGFGYDGNMRLTAITDAIGQVTTLLYTNADIWKITRVTDPFGRSASVGYDNQGRLNSITDVIGLNSSFAYGTNGLIESMTTPYGTHTFSYTTNFVEGNSDSRFIVVTDPQGEKECMLYKEPITLPAGFVGATPPTNIVVGASNVYFFAENDDRMVNRNSFYWSKKAMREAPLDLGRARNYRWYTDKGWLLVPVLEAIKEPLEERVWFNYPGTSATGGNSGLPAYLGGGQRPTKTLRMVDGRPELYQTYYNEFGNPTLIIDPLGRQTDISYASNGFDVVAIRQKNGNTNDLLFQATYNGQRRPLAITGANGGITRMGYNARGQVTAVTNALGNVVTFTYNASGYLTGIDGPLTGTQDLTRIAYDGFGRPRSVTLPDGYAVTNDYDALDRVTRVSYPDGTSDQFTYSRLDLATMTDRLGRQVTNTYDSMRHLIASKDPLGRVTRFDWCGCGGLDALIDPLGQATRFDRDIQGRVRARIFADGSKIKCNYHKDSGRLASVVDEIGQTKLYSYNKDGAVGRIDYSGQEATPSVIYNYDASYARIASTVDGVGTTLYSFHQPGAPGGLALASIVGPFTNSFITYAYDLSGQLTNRNLSSLSVSLVRDFAGRLTSARSPVGEFTFAYEGGMDRPKYIGYPGGFTSRYTYAQSPSDPKLIGIRYGFDNTNALVQFGFSRDAIGRIHSWTQMVDGTTSIWHCAYDLGGRLTSVVIAAQSSTQALSYAFDHADNRTMSFSNATQRRSSYDVLNQLRAVSPGNLPNITNRWDAASRLVSCQIGTNLVTLHYGADGLPLAVILVQGGVTTLTRHLTWEAGQCVVESLTGATNVTAANIFGTIIYTGNTTTQAIHTARDHRGSTWCSINQSRQIASRVEYDPWGREHAILKPNHGVRGYDSMLRMPELGLNLSAYRVYSPAAGRWLSRDPLMELEGYNLYTYAYSDPINYSDSSGLSPVSDIVQFVLKPVLQYLGKSPDEAAAITTMMAPFLDQAFPGGYLGLPNCLRPWYDLLSSGMAFGDAVALMSMLPSRIPIGAVGGITIYKPLTLAASVEMNPVGWAIGAFVMGYAVGSGANAVYEIVSGQPLGADIYDQIHEPSSGLNGFLDDIFLPTQYLAEEAGR